MYITSLFVSYWNFLQNDSIDVLEDHRTRNHAMRPPNILANEHQLEDDDNLNKSDMGDDADEAEGDESSAQRARRHSKTPWNTKPKSTTMKYYPQSWQAMLEIAKNNMRKYVALINAFPQRDRDLKEATLILKNTITEYQRSGNTLEPGFYRLSF